MLNCIIQRSKQLLIILVVLSALYVTTVLYVMQLSGKSNINITNVYTILEHVKTGIISAKKYFNEEHILIAHNIGKTRVLKTFLSPSSTIQYLPNRSTFRTDATEKQFPTGPLGCYYVQKKSLPDISDIKLRKSKTIFFLETSCRSHTKGRIAITARQACAVESAARTNPNFDVFLFFTSPGTIRYAGTESDKFLKALLSYPNIKMHHLDFQSYLKNTPLEDFYESGKLEWSRYPITHASDILRFLTLWKYGGIYLDLDIITIKSLESLSQNFVVLETFTDSAVGAIGFTATGNGHRLAEFCVNDLKHNFRGYSWDQNGPRVATRLVENMCKAKLTKNVVNKTCNGLKIYSHETFYPGPSWQAYFNISLNDIVLNMSKHSYGIHVWNTLSEFTQIDVKTSNVSYAFVARKYCPKVFKKCKKYF